MSREWKPGDVAMFNQRGGFEHVMPGAIFVDPENEEAVERLCKAFVAAGVWKVIPVDVVDHHAHRRTQVKAALLSLRQSSKPAEPTGLGAVVEVQSQFADGETRRLVRTHNSTQPWFGDTISQTWDNIPGPVKVLSEGVTA